MNNRLSDIGECKSDSEDRIKWKLLNQNSKKQSKFQKMKTVSEISGWGSTKCTNIHIVRAQKEERERRGTKCI